VSLMNTNGNAGGVATIGTRAKDAGATAVQGVVQGVQGAKEWAAPRLGDAVQGAREWAAPRLEDATDAVTETVVQGVQGAREWAAPRLEDAADAVTETVAPKVSSALRSTARQVRPEKPAKTGLHRLLDWRWLVGIGAVAAAAGAAGAITVRRRYASATAAANDATESFEGDRPAEGSDSAADAAMRSEVNGRVTTPGN
jgi:hypothetical protein